jgi:hypothetical protein
MSDDVPLETPDPVERNGTRQLAECQLKSNQKYWRDDLIKHFAASFVTLMVICGGAIAALPTPSSTINEIPSERILMRAFLVVVGAAIVISLGVRRGIWIRFANFSDDVSYDTVPTKTEVSRVFQTMGMIAYVTIAGRACMDLQSHSKVPGCWKAAVCIVAGLGLIAIPAIAWSCRHRTRVKRENPDDKTL